MEDLGTESLTDMRQDFKCFVTILGYYIFFANEICKLALESDDESAMVRDRTMKNLLD